MSPPEAFTFPRVTRADYALLRGWLAQPHVRAWWGDPEEDIALIDKDIQEGPTDMRLVVLGDLPFAYVQDYPAHHWDAPHYAGFPPGARGVDTFLGDPAFLGQGHAPRYLYQRCRDLMAAGATAVVIDPSPDNERAVRCYLRAGFVPRGITPCEDGDPVLVMEFDLPSSSWQKYPSWVSAQKTGPEKRNDMKHFLDIHKTDAAELRAMIDSAHAMKSARNGRPRGAPDDDQPLKGRMVALIFEKPSTRTRVSFDVGVRQMGGETMVLSGKEMQLGHGETIADTARVLSRYVDLIMIRTFEEATLLEMAEHATVPVINGLTNRTHPCQIMADVMTYEEHRGPIAGKKVVWCGDGNNVAASFLHAAGQFGFDFTFTGPETLDPEEKFVDFARGKGSKVTIQRDPFTAVEGADLVVTDTWVSMHDPESAKERRHNQLRPYQVNEQLMSRAKSDALFMHCLPAHRNDEATSAVMDGPHSVIFDEAENRLHAQKAVMRWCLGV